MWLADDGGSLAAVIELLLLVWLVIGRSRVLLPVIIVVDRRILLSHRIWLIGLAGMPSGVCLTLDGRGVGLSGILAVIIVVIIIIYAGLILIAMAGLAVWIRGGPAVIRILQFMDGNRADGCPAAVGELNGRNAAVKNKVVPVMIPRVEVVDHNAGAINPADLGGRAGEAARMRIAKMAAGDENKVIHREAEIKANADAIAPVEETQTRTIDGEGRQWCPAAIVIGITPGHPGRRPDRIRPPAPAETGIAKPPAVMERGAPGVVGLPIPAAVGTHPASAIAIRLPAMII